MNEEKEIEIESPEFMQAAAEYNLYLVLHDDNIIVPQAIVRILGTLEAERLAERILEEVGRIERDNN